MTAFQLTGDNKGQTLVVLYEDGGTATVPESHPKFKEILDLVRTKSGEDEDIKLLVNTLHEIGQRLSTVTERISVAPYGVFFDGDPLRGELADFLLELFNEGRTQDFTSVANFLEKAATNPSIESIDALYKWITNGDLVITPTGDFVAYKGVQVNSKGESQSINSGTAFVNGEIFVGHIPNPDGAVISMPRSKVNANNGVGCSTGLHAGTYSYASMFGQGRLLLVQINPRDVVSVPNDSSFQKLRVSRYTVVSHIENRLTSRLYGEYEEEETPVKSDGDFEDDTNLAEAESEPETSCCDLCDEDDDNCVVGDVESCDYKDEEAESDTAYDEPEDPERYEEDEWTLRDDESVTSKDEKSSGIKSAFRRFLTGE